MPSPKKEDVAKVPRDAVVSLTAWNSEIAGWRAAGPSGLVVKTSAWVSRGCGFKSWDGPGEPALVAGVSGILFGLSDRKSVV